MKLLITGFNARPIAKSAVQAGYEIGTVDYFGDIDLLELSKNCFSVLRQKPNEKLHRPLHRLPPQYLYILSEIMVEEQGDFDGILIGSAFDRFPDLIAKFGALGPTLYANSSENFALTRDKFSMFKLAKAAGFEIPETISVKSSSEFLDVAKSQSYPLVTREGGGGGGAGIKLWKDYESLERYFSERSEDFIQKVLIQELISGVDCSSSVICSRGSVQVLSINRQLIGDTNLGAPGRFAFCGNIVPLYEKNFSNDKEFQRSLLESIEQLFSRIPLLGSNGVDFVIQDGKVYFMEINPRFQGSLDCIQYATGYNLVQLHIDSFEGIIHDLPVTPNYRRTSVKGILFSSSDQLIRVKSYPKSKWIVDRTHFGVLLEKGDPFCSIILTARTAEKGYQKVCRIAEKILKMNQ